MPDAFCASCDRPCAPMIVSGWGMCGRCKERVVYDFTAVNENVTSKAGRDFIKREIRRSLPHTKEAG